MVYKAGELNVDPTKIQIQLPPSESGTPGGVQPGQPETPQQTLQEEKQEGENAQSLEDAFKGAPAPAPAPTPAPAPAPPPPK